jgi:adenylate cyclase
MEAAAGSGFTNVVIDSDGVRRRILLARELDGLWYLQLAFAPLIDFLGRPELILEKNRLTLKGVMLGEEKKRDIVIPLDNSGAMLLDWPLETYDSSFTHVSFAVFSRLENLEQQILGYLNNLSDSDYRFFGDTMNVARSALQYLDAAQEARRRAVTRNSDEAFDEFLSLQEEWRRQVKALLESGVAVREAAEVRDLAESIPSGSRERLLEEADYMTTSAEYLGTVFAGLEEIDRRFREILPGKFCIAGRVDTGTTDIGVNPFHEQYVNVGTHGVVLDTIQRESFIIPLDRIWSLLLAFLFAPVLIVLLSSLKPLLRFIIGFFGAVILFAVSLLLLSVFGIFLDPLVPGLSLFAAVIIREVVAFMNSEQEKQFIRKALSTYTSPAVADVIIQNPSLFTLGGDRRNMTAIFTDIRSFSTVSEALKNPETGEADPKRLVNLLNVYLTRMSDIVLDNQGTIDKYEGDAIIAFFGAPLPMEDHAFLACRSAITMRKAEVAFNREARERELIDDAVLQALVNKGIIKTKDDPSPIMTRIGINTGSMVVGNMGTENKMNYTIMGNAVNLAARLEGVNKQYGTVILTSGNTIRETGDKILNRRLDRVRVVGITEPVWLHELVDLREDASEAETEMVRLFQEALDIFEARDWTAAKENFLKVLNLAPEDNPSAIYLDRCEKFRQTPPAHDWDGVFNLNEK